jgi:hypothetical protein
MELFGRRYTLTVGTVQIKGEPGKGLRIAFKVHASLAKDPNTAEIKIYNLSPDNRAKLQGKGVPIILSAGYDTTEASIFSGDSRYITHESEGPTWVTKIQSGDGERIFAFARMSKSYAAGVSPGTILREAVAATSLKPGNLEAAISEIPRGGLATYARGYVAHGRAIDVIDSVAKSIGFSVSVQSGVLQFLRGGVAPGPAVLLSPKTGLVGSPAFSNPEKKGEAPRLLVKSLLQPSIVCGGQVSVQSENVKGAFRVQKLDHTGDTMGSEWYTSLEVNGL